LIGIYRKKFEKIPAGILLSCSGDFWCFPAGYVDFPASFLQDPVGGIIDLGRFHTVSTELFQRLDLL
jgi:hypothetical protein